jgi:hypothetical protein
MHSRSLPIFYRRAQHFSNHPMRAMRASHSMIDNREENPDKSHQNRLYPDDQARVDEFISRGVNSVKRKPFRPMRLMIMLIVVVVGLSVLSQLIARWSGIY